MFLWCWFWVVVLFSFLFFCQYFSRSSCPGLCPEQSFTGFTNLEEWKESTLWKGTVTYNSFWLLTSKNRPWGELNHGTSGEKYLDELETLDKCERGQIFPRLGEKTYSSHFYVPFLWLRGGENRRSLDQQRRPGSNFLEVSHEMETSQGEKKRQKTTMMFRQKGPSRDLGGDFFTPNTRKKQHWSCGPQWAMWRWTKDRPAAAVWTDGQLRT